MPIPGMTSSDLFGLKSNALPFGTTAKPKIPAQPALPVGSPTSSIYNPQLPTATGSWGRTGPTAPAPVGLPPFPQPAPQPAGAAPLPTGQMPVNQAAPTTPKVDALPPVPKPLPVPDAPAPVAKPAAAPVQPGGVLSADKIKAMMATANTALKTASTPAPTPAPMPVTAPWDQPGYQEPAPPPAGTQAGQGGTASGADAARAKQEAANAAAQAAQKGAGQAQQGAAGVTDAKVAGKTGAAPAPGQANPAQPATPAATPASTEPTLDQQLQDFSRILNDFATGKVDDKVFRTAINRAVLTMGLNNQAERDALQMQINQDPALRGQGAGYALLSVMGRNQNFNADQLFGQLAEESQQRILDLQKYGIEQGTKINEMRRNRAKDNFETLFKTGQFDAAGKSLQAIIDQDFPGSGITVDGKTMANRDPLNRADLGDQLDQIKATALTDPTAAVSQVQAIMDAHPERFAPGMTAQQYVDNLKEDAKRDQFSISQFTSKMSLIKDIATTNPAAAAAMLTTIMADPSYRDWFPEGATADQLIQSFTAGNESGNISEANTIETEINKSAVAGQGYDEVSGHYDDLFRLQGRNAVKEGRRLSLDEVNQIRGADGLPGFTQDQDGTLLDENGIPLTDEDYADLAYRKDYRDKTDKANEQPWEQAKKIILSGPNAAKFLDPALFPGAKDALDSYLEAYFTNPGNFITDPKTGQLVPDTSKLQLPWKSKEYYHLFYTWPRAAFNEDGSITTDAAGKPVMDPGGDIYGETVNGETVQATPEDQDLDQKWVKYTRSGGTLTAPQWYFATAGGTRPVDEAKVPKSVMGSTTTGDSGSDAPVAPNTRESGDAAMDLFYGFKNLPSTVKDSEVQTIVANVNEQKLDSTTITAMAKDKSLPGAKDIVMKKVSTVNGGGRSGPPSGLSISILDEGQVTQPVKDFAGFYRLKQAGLNDTQAAALMKTLIGEERFKTAYKRMTGKDWKDA